MKKSESILELSKALSKFQGEVKQPLKDKANPFFRSKYVPLESVAESISETAAKHGLSYMQFPVNEVETIRLVKNGIEEINTVQKVGVYTLVMHDSGEWIETDVIYAVPAKQDAQGVGAVVTYLRRYSLSAVFGITSDEDDDGNRTVPVKKPPKQQEEPVIDLAKTLAECTMRTNIPSIELYQEVSSSLGINKPTKDLNEQEKKAIIAVLLKK